ncbi:MAG: hypothetical protein CMH53_07215 [Myxococcales bacterium]|nr:hypothetical protein [Myxococcales bacterium]
MGLLSLVACGHESSPSNSSNSSQDAVVIDAVTSSDGGSNDLEDAQDSTSASSDVGYSDSEADSTTADDVDPDGQADSTESVDTWDGTDTGFDATQDAGADSWKGVDPKTCDAGDKAWVRRAMLVITGRLPSGVHEIGLWTQVIDALGRSKTAEIMAHHPNYYQRWTEWVSDELRANRIGFRQQPMCFGKQTLSSASADLAKHIRDHGPMTSASTTGATMRDVLTSALYLDDLTPAWRANVFAAIVRGQPYCVNAGPMNMEALRRRDFADRFAEVYTGRTAECAPCHNSAFSVNDDPDPKKDHFWPMPGHFEKSVFGSHAMEPQKQWQAMFRRMGVVSTAPSVFYYIFKEPAAPLPAGAPKIRPWGLHAACGEFISSSMVAADPLNETGKFLGYSGSKGTVWEVESGLKQGVDQLRKSKMSIDPNTQQMPANEGLAWLMSSRIAHQVWLEGMGMPLTVSHGFPRNKAQRDKLYGLTEAFIATQWSLRKLLALIVTDPDFNRASPASGCAANDPYALEPIYNPWSVGHNDPQLHPNTVGDAVHRLPARLLLSATYETMGWALPSSFGHDAHGEFEATIGAYVSDGKIGFKSPTFQGILAWEHRFGMCQPHGELVDKQPGAKFSMTSCAGRCGKPSIESFGCVCDASCNLVGDCCDDITSVCEMKPAKNGDDFVDKLVSSAASNATATVADVASALKDRLLLEPSISSDEAPLIADLFGVQSLSTPANTLNDLAKRLRTLCGTLMTTPQFQLTGLSAPEFDVQPTFTVTGFSKSDICKARASDTFGPAGYTLSCSPTIQVK